MLGEKILVAKMLAEAGVDVIEAGFARSRVDADSIRAVVDSIGTDATAPTIASLSRASRLDIDASYEALSKAKRPRIHTFIATSPIHMREKLGMTGDEVLAAIRESVSYAVSTGMEVQWSAEDATNSSWPFLLEAVTAAVESGATVINIPDTLGGSNPWAMESLFRYLTENTTPLKAAGKEFVFSVHTHNDNGLALANALAAIRGGARQVECTVLGIGERTGNVATHQTVAYLKEFGHSLVPGIRFDTNVRESAIFPVSLLVSRILGTEIRPNEPIIGSRTNSHGSGIHTDGAIKGKRESGADIYSVIDTSRYGNPGEIKTFNARGGAAEAIEMLSAYVDVSNISKTDVESVITRAATLAEACRGIYPSLVYGLYLETIGRFSLDSIEIHETHHVTIGVSIDGKPFVLKGRSNDENGVIAATMDAINRFLGESNSLNLTHFHAEDRPSPQELSVEFFNDRGVEGSLYGTGESLGIVTFELRDRQGRTIRTRYASSNVDEAGVKALVYGAVEKIVGALSKDGRSAGSF
jgi:2-isopropylmalate synthase